MFVGVKIGVANWDDEAVGVKTSGPSETRIARPEAMSLLLARAEENIIM
jgi:hypothetical protein